MYCHKTYKTKVGRHNQNTSDFLQSLGWSCGSRVLVIFPDHFKELTPFSTWVRNDVVSTMKEGETIDKYTLHMSMPPTLEARLYQTMFAFGNHIRVSNVEEHLTTFDSGVAATFEWECRLGPNDRRPILAKLEYVGWVEEILELNYSVLRIMVLLCN